MSFDAVLLKHDPDYLAWFAVGGFVAALLGFQFGATVIVALAALTMACAFKMLREIKADVSEVRNLLELRHLREQLTKLVRARSQQLKKESRRETEMNPGEWETNPFLRAGHQTFEELVGHKVKISKDVHGRMVVQKMEGLDLRIIGTGKLSSFGSDDLTTYRLIGFDDD